MTTILVVDDREVARREVVEAIDDLVEIVEEATNEGEAVAKIKAKLFDVAIVDLELTQDQRDEGLVVLREARRIRPDLPVIVVTAYVSKDLGARAMHDGAFDYIERGHPGLDFQELLRHKVQIALKFRELRRRLPVTAEITRADS